MKILVKKKISLTFVQRITKVTTSSSTSTLCFAFRAVVENNDGTSTTLTTVSNPRARREMKFSRDMPFLPPNR